jgi:hypothetical protein
MGETPQQRGGRARAERLTPEERSKIASAGGAARWGDMTARERSALPRASHMGERKVDGWVIPLFNLFDGRRLFSERGFLSLIGVRGRGSTGGHRLNAILRDPLLKSFFSLEILVAIENPIRFISPTETLVLGYEAEVLSEFCIGFTKARSAGILITEVQRRYAEYCENLVHAYARMGIEAWIDEATGFQTERKRDALHRILERYLSAHWATWAKTFPDDYYEQVFRLRAWKYDPASLAKPQVLGHITNDIVYSRLAPGVLTALREKNPVVDGRRIRKHHQWLTRDYGHPELKRYIDKLIFLMQGSTSWRSFHAALQRSAPRLHDQGEFDFDDY